MVLFEIAYRSLAGSTKDLKNILKKSLKIGKLVKLQYLINTWLQNTGKNIEAHNYMVHNLHIYGRKME